MSNNITLKKSSVADKVPLSADLQFGELALNYADGNLFYKNSSNVVTTLSSNKFVSVTGNVTGNYFIGNGSQLTGVVATAAPAGNTTEIQYNASGTTGASANLTFNGTTLSVVGNVTGSYFIGNGSELTSITGANVTGTVANATFAASAYSAFAAASSIDASRVTANAQPNITSVGILTSLSVTGNITGGNVKTGNITIGTDVIRSANTVITIDPAADGISGLVVIAGNLQVTGTTTTVDSTVVTINDLMLNVANNAATSAEANGGGLGVGPVGAEYAKLYWDSAGNSWDSTHGISAVGIVTATSFSGSGAGLTSIPGANVTGTVANATSATTAGTVTSNAQPNITSVGTLSSLSVTGNISSGNIVTTGSAGNITGANVISATTFSATGNITGSYIIGNGSLLTGLSSGSSYSNANVAAYLPTYTGNLVSLTGPVTTTGNVTGNYIIGNGALLTGLPASYSNANVAAYLPTYTGNLVSLTGPVTTTGNITGGNISTAGAISAIGNITGGNIITSGLAGNITGANVISATTFSATGNITAANYFGNGKALVGTISWTTVANTAPAGAKPGDFWYNSFSGIKYQYINDGTSNVWVDQSYPTTFSSLAVAGNGTIGGTLAVTGNVSAPLFVGTATQARYADLAENYSADVEYAPGTVVVFGGTHEVTVSAVSHDTRVAGVVSTAPAYLMNSDQLGAAVALTGKVPCQVQGPVGKGDLLVNISAGTAGRLDPAQYRPGCVVGKSLESIPDKITRTIEIAVGRF